MRGSALLLVLPLLAGVCASASRAQSVDPATVARQYAHLVHANYQDTLTAAMAKCGSSTL